MTAVTVVSCMVATSNYSVLFLLGISYFVISLRAHRDIVLY